MSEMKDRNIIGLALNIVQKLPFVQHFVEKIAAPLLPQDTGIKIVDTINKIPFLKGAVKDWVENLPNKNETLPKVLTYSNTHFHVPPMKMMSLIF
ncbi:MAG: hypothetical protein ACFFG0_07140 [Candidatus Thorarchaeota archaeon]